NILRRDGRLLHETMHGKTRMNSSERSKEIKRRRHRRKQLNKLKAKAPKANVSETEHIKQKVRKLTPGAEQILKNWNLAE
ncbi:MAG: hypothetical protein N2C14_22205, partial [Planctomycetales bacterium]